MWKKIVEQLRIWLFEYLTAFFEDTGRPRLFSFCRGGLFVSFVSRFAGLFRVPRGFSFLVVYLIPLLERYCARPGRRPTTTCHSRFSLPFSFLFLNRPSTREINEFEARNFTIPSLRPRIDARDAFPLIRSIVQRRLDNETAKWC